MSNKIIFFGDWKVTKNSIINTSFEYIIDKKELICFNNDWITHISEKNRDWEFINFCKAYIYFLKNLINEEN
jgi:hypothetical protein